MDSRAKLLGHPIHQMLIVFPLGLLAMAIIFDVLALAFANGYWSEIAFWMIAAGVVTGLLAAPFGAIDWFAIPSGTRAKRIGVACDKLASGMRRACCFDRSGRYSKGNMGAPEAAEQDVTRGGELVATHSTGEKPGPRPALRASRSREAGAG